MDSTISPKLRLPRVRSEVITGTIVWWAFSPSLLFYTSKSKLIFLGYPLFLLYVCFLKKSPQIFQHFYFALTGILVSYWALGGKCFLKSIIVSKMSLYAFQFRPSSMGHCASSSHLLSPGFSVGICHQHYFCFSFNLDIFNGVWHLILENYRQNISKMKWLF